MKIKELKGSFNETSQLIKLKYEEPSVKRGGSNVQVSKFSGLKRYRQGIQVLESTGLLVNEISAIRDSGIFSTIKDVLELNTSEGRQLNAKISNLSKLVNELLATFTNLSGTNRENSISIKLPDISDFDDLSKTSSIFHKVLSQAILNDHIKGEVKIDNVENGSIWLDVYLGSVAAVTVIGGLSWAAAVVYKKIQEGRIFEEHVRSLKVKNESIKDIKEAQKKALELVIEAEARQLYSENFKSEEELNDDNEQIERLKHSINLLAEQIQKGAEIHPALNSPEKVSNLFPDMKQLDLLESKIKKITA